MVKTTDIVRASILIGILLAIPGCVTWSAYPPQNMTDRMTNPSNEPIPTLMTGAIRFAHMHYGSGEDDFAINLPEGIPHEIYTRVIRKLGLGHPMTEPGETTYHVLEIRLRGLEAEVDLLYPRRGSIYELVTITFRRRLVEGWSVLTSRLWRKNVALPRPNYVPPETKVLPTPDLPSLSE